MKVLPINLQVRTQTVRTFLFREDLLTGYPQTNRKGGRKHENEKMVKQHPILTSSISSGHISGHSPWFPSYCTLIYSFFILYGIIPFNRAGLLRERKVKGLLLQEEKHFATTIYSPTFHIPKTFKYSKKNQTCIKVERILQWTAVYQTRSFTINTYFIIIHPSKPVSIYSPTLFFDAFQNKFQISVYFMLNTSACI